MVVTIAAAVLRLVKLGDIPYGVHSDEAQVGTDAHRILSDGWIGVYTHAALGQPTGHAYLTTPSIWLLGDTALALRLPLALVGLAAVPLLYVLVRVSFRRAEAFFAAGMLAVSYWHLFYSRVAHWSISYGTVLLGVLLCVMLGMRSGRAWWYVGAGILLGVGVYTYNIYPVAVVATSAFIAVISVRVWLTARRGAPSAPGDESADAPHRTALNPPAPRAWLRGIALLGVAALVVALAMIWYVSDPHAYYWQHFNNYEDVRITRTPEYADADLWGRIGLIAGQAKYFASAYAWHGREDIVDANGLRPVFDPVTLALLGAGLIIAWRYRREPMVIAALCGLVILPLPALLQKGSIMREPVGAAPYAMFFAALPLAAAWRFALAHRGGVRAAAAAGVIVALALIMVATVRDYFWTLREDAFVRYIYFSQMTSASEYMRDVPKGTYVYFYSDHASINLETRQYLAPHVIGEDRSRTFGGGESEFPVLRPGDHVVFMLLDTYENLLPQMQRAYPGGTAYIERRDGKFEFAAYGVVVPPG